MKNGRVLKLLIKENNRSTYAKASTIENQYWQGSACRIRQRLLVSVSLMADTVCHICEEHEARFQCTLCGPDYVLCQGCLIYSHSGVRALHPVLRFTKQYGKELVGFAGSEVSGPHTCGACQGPTAMRSVMMSDVGWCGDILVQGCVQNTCTGFDERLIDIGFFPGNSNKHKSKVAFSLKLLELYRSMNLRTGIAANAFMRSISGFQYGNEHPTVVYRYFLRAVVEYRQTMIILERLEGVGVSDLFSGCMACPRAHEEGRMHICADGCFRLPRLKKPREVQNMRPLLDRMFIGQQEMKDYLTMIGADDTPDDTVDKECSDFYALTEPVKRKFLAFDETGIFGASCARHGPIIKLTDTFKGERLSIFDYILIKTFLPNDKRKLTVYYDVGCRYLPHIKKTPVLNVLPIMCFLLVAVPIFHVYAHGIRCLKRMSPRVVQGCGMTDGEESERIWAMFGQHHKSTKEMKAFSRRIVLEDQAHFQWITAHEKMPGRINSRDRKYDTALQAYRSTRATFKESDEELDQLSLESRTKDRPKTLRVRHHDAAEISLYRIDLNIRRSRNNIVFLQACVNRRGAASDHKIRRTLQKQLTSLYKSIEKNIVKRNEYLLVCNPETLAANSLIYGEELSSDAVHDKNREHPFWHVDPSHRDDGLDQLQVDTWDLLKRHIEELDMLKNEQTMWIKHAKEDMQRLIDINHSDVTESVPELFKDDWFKAQKMWCHRRVKSIRETAMKAGWIHGLDGIGEDMAF